MAVGSAGQQVANYRLVRELGRGGMGEVWLAEHVAIASRVAIKLIAADDDDHARDRFLREAKAAASVRHPGIVAVSDFGTLEHGGAYLVMELLEGESLAQRLARGPLGEPATLELALQVADALAAAHAAGIVHRDLKPANVFLVRDIAVRGGTRARLLDFGIAKPTLSHGDISLTASDAIIGTPMYMAPEQCASRFGPVDARSDLYALGIVIYEMIAGKPPFAGPTLGDLIEQQVHVEPVGSSRVDLQACKLEYSIVSPK